MSATTKTTTKNLNIKENKIQRNRFVIIAKLRKIYWYSSAISLFAGSKAAGPR